MQCSQREADLGDDVPDGHLATGQTNAGEGQQNAANHHDGHSKDRPPLACIKDRRQQILPNNS